MMNFHEKLGINLKTNHLWAENRFDENHRNFNRNEFRPLQLCNSIHYKNISNENHTNESHSD